MNTLPMHEPAESAKTLPCLTFPLPSDEHIPSIPPAPARPSPQTQTNQKGIPHPIPSPDHLKRIPLTEFMFLTKVYHRIQRCEILWKQVTGHRPLKKVTTRPTKSSQARKSRLFLPSQVDRSL